MIDENILITIENILKSTNLDNKVIPPTLLYNEGWLLRLILNWFNENRNIKNHPLAFGNDKKIKWYSEPLLPTPFKATSRKDAKSESRTHADGVFGHFVIGKNNKTGKTSFNGLSFVEYTSHFCVIEAKMYSKLSKGIRNSENYNQAARNIACICELMREKSETNLKYDKIAFYILLPEIQIKKEKSFTDLITKQNLMEAINSRVGEYLDTLDFSWLKNNLEKIVKIIDTQLISWESIINFIKLNDVKFGQSLQTFYDNCRRYNDPKLKKNIY